MVGYTAYAIAAAMRGTPRLPRLIFALPAPLPHFSSSIFRQPVYSWAMSAPFRWVFWLALSACCGWQRGLWPLWFPGVVFSPFIVDASVTLVRRALRGEKVWQAHRSHYYQRLVMLGWSHRQLARTEYVLMVAQRSGRAGGYTTATGSASAHSGSAIGGLHRGRSCG